MWYLKFAWIFRWASSRHLHRGWNTSFWRAWRVEEIQTPQKSSYGKYQFFSVCAKSKSLRTGPSMCLIHTLPKGSTPQLLCIIQRWQTFSKRWGVNSCGLVQLCYLYQYSSVSLGHLITYLKHKTKQKKLRGRYIQEQWRIPIISALGK